MPEILHQLKINAPVRRVYEALSTQDGVSRWWTRDTLMKSEVGSIAKFGFNKRAVVFEMRIDRLDHDRRVKWSCIGGHPEWESTEIIFEMRLDPAGTLLRFGHMKWKSADGILPLCSYDWARYLTSLKSYLETGKGSPHTG